MAEGDFELVLYHGAGSLTFNSATDPDALDVKSRPLDMNENQPWMVTVRLHNDTSADSVNLLSSSCALWSSGTGALDIGDRADFSLYSTSAPTTKAAVLSGTVVSIAPHDDFTVDVVIADRLAAYQGVGRSVYKTFYKNYRDTVYKTHSVVGGKIVFSGFSEANIATPLALLALLTDDTATDIGVPDDVELITGFNSINHIGQSFYMTQSALVGVRFKLRLDSTCPATDILVDVCEDDAGGLQPGTVVATATIPSASMARDGAYHDWWVSFMDASSVPLALTVGKRYWLHFHATAALYLGLWRVRGKNNPSCPAELVPVVFSQDGVTWGQVSGYTTHVVSFTTYTAEWSDQSTGKQTYDASAGTVTLEESDKSLVSNLPATFPSSWAPRRGKASYYYGLKNVKEVLAGIIGLGPCTAAVNSAIGKQVNLYRIKGRYLSDCLGELVELRESSGSWSGSQLVMAANRHSSTDYVYVSRRKNLADTSSRTFSHADDAASDDEDRIISFTPTKVIKGRPCVVTVTGQSETGDPIIVTVSDQSLSGGGYSAKSGVVLEVSITDNSLKTPLDCALVGYAKLDSVARDQWEGTLKVDGVFPDLFDLNYSSATYGSGAIITLNYSPYGIVAQKFKVRGLRVGTDDGNNFVTELQISNMSTLISNPFMDTSVTTLRNESFISPTDAQTTFYYRIIDNGVITASGSPYIELMLNETTSLHGAVARAAASKIENAVYNQRIHHAEIPAGSGYTVDGTDLVTYVRYTDGANDFVLPIEPAKQFPKWKNMRVIVEIVSKIS